MRTVEVTIDIKAAQGAEDIETWKYFREMLEHLSVGGMSSEDDGVWQIGTKTISVFLVKLCVWRAPAINEYLQHIDGTCDNIAIRGTRGSKAVPRIRVDQPGMSRVPKGLPYKMYDETWLNNQKSKNPYILGELQVSQEAFDLLVQVTGENDA